EQEASARYDKAWAEWGGSPGHVCPEICARDTSKTRHQITDQASRNHVGADYDKTLPAFTACRQCMAQFATQFSRLGRFENDGAILVRSHEIRPDTCSGYVARGTILLR